MSPGTPTPKSLAWALAALCLVSACSGKPREVITEQKIKAILEEIDRAALKQDVDAIVKHFSRDAKITIHINSSAKPRPGGAPFNVSMTMTRDEYRDYFKSGSAGVKQVEYLRQDTIIKIDPDGQMAAVGDRILETAVRGSETIRAVSEETAVFGLEDGRVVITSLEGKLYL